ncbi:hypothetical protein HMI51_19570 [Corallococcus coralloides]|uniref:hypothetical protein n=1 Tax=Corallococcus sp. CA049B TaxID=2316730 RepID=UPI0011C3ADCB|nr:hypothetical protein [Corallococcus sp. CA049B]NOJ95127.1 hypothetical protein [Corallococcus coralloides]
MSLPREAMSADEKSGEGLMDISLAVELGATIRQALKSEDRAGYVLAYADTVQQAQAVCREVSTRLVLETA